MRDAALTHPHPNSIIACGAYAAAIAAGVAGAGRQDMLRAAEEVAAGEGGADVRRTLRRAIAGEAPADYMTSMGWVLLALHNAFWHLASGADVETALIRTVAAGGDTDTNAAIAGALLGTCQGRAAFPPRWTMKVLTCRPDPGLGARQPRPEEYWPDDLIELAEALLLSQPRFRTGQEGP